MLSNENEITTDMSSKMKECIECITGSLPEVLAIYLFGSAISGQMHANSDVDMAVYAEQKFDRLGLWHVSRKLADIVGRDVDLVDLHAASSVMRMQVISGGERLFCADGMACEQFEDIVFSEYARLNEERSGILADIRKRGSVYG